MFLTAVNYGLIKLNNEKAWPDGFKLLEYDDAARRLRSIR